MDLIVPISFLKLFPGEPLLKDFMHPDFVG